MKTTVIFGALIFVLPTVALASFPRTVMNCKKTEGVSNLQEERPGIYSFIATHGFTGERSGGVAKLAMEVSNQAGHKTCTLKIEAGAGSQKTSKIFSWESSENIGVLKVKSSDAEDGTCEISRRYSPSFGKCELSSENEPGSQCHGEGGQDVTASLPNNAKVPRKVIGFSGGMSIETDAKDISMTGKGFSVWRNPNDSNSWCYELNTLFPQKCQKLSDPLQIKNKEGKIVGILRVDGASILFRQAKAPFQDSGYTLDENEAGIRLSNTEMETNIIAQKSGRDIGKIQILGTVLLPERLKSYNRPPVDLTAGKTVTSDCNGLVEPANVKKGRASTPAAR